MVLIYSGYLSEKVASFGWVTGNSYELDKVVILSFKLKIGFFEEVKVPIIDVAVASSYGTMGYGF